MDTILADHVNWLAVTYRNSIRNWRGKRPIMSSLQNVTEQANFRTKLAKRILSYDIKLRKELVEPRRIELLTS